MKKNFFKVIFCIILFFCLIFNVYAYQSSSQITIQVPIPIGTGRDNTSAGNCDPSLCPLYSAGGHLGFRFTLVDFQGNKLPGTRSVDYTGSNLLTIVENGINFYGYRFDMNLDSDPDKVKLITIRDEQNGTHFPINATEFLQFMNNEFVDIYSEDYSYQKSSGEVQSRVSFLEAFFHDAGLLGDNEVILTSKSKIANTVIIIEPTVRWSYMVGSATHYIYGTFSELSKYSIKIREAGNTTIFNSGWVPELLHTRLCVTNAELKMARDKLGLKDSDSDSFLIKNGAPYADCTVPGFYNQNLNLQYVHQDYKFYEAHKDLINTDYGFGVFLGIVPAELRITKENVESGLLACDYSGGKISFNADNFTNPLQYEGMYSDLGMDASNGIYCYDSNVSYDFSEMLSSLNRKNFNRLTYVNPTSGKLSVTRKCYVERYALIDGQPNKPLLQEFEDDYNNQIVSINLYEKNYDIKPTNLKVSIDEKNSRKNFGTEGGALFVYSLVADYNVEKNSLFIGYDYQSKNSGFISLKNFNKAFGASNNLLSDKTKVYISSDKVADKYDSELDDKMRCNFSFDVSNPESEINFRVISLENPFPGRDGTSRMPSKNWFYDNNYVYDYILNNRGIRSTLCRNISETCLNSVSPEQMYSTLEPMYRITLTPSTMLEIREYNKNYSYYSMYDTSYAEEHNHENENVRKDDKNADKLICDEYGRQCYSQFLRDPDYIPQDDGDLSSGTGSLSGKCVLVKNFKSMNDSTVRMELSKYSFYDESTYPLSNLYTYIFSGKNEGNVNVNLYDVNYNGRIDNEDYEIIFQYQTDELAGLPGKNTQYYTCAKKSYFSGGPVDVGGDD